MSKIAEQKAQEYEKSLDYYHYTSDNPSVAYQQGYEQAEKETIERACQLLYDYNKQMAKMFGAKAVLSCNQFTIDVERFRKTLIIEEE